VEESKQLAKTNEVVKLTLKNKAFLQHLAAGRPTLEAYALAGYKGEPHAAYQLRSELRQHLAILLEQGGFSRESLAVEVNRLNSIPLDPMIQNVNFKQKMDILRLMDKALPKLLDANTKVSITPFVVFGMRKEGAKVEKTDIVAIDAEIVEPAPKSEGQDPL
jgi:hypothetical protein